MIARVPRVTNAFPVRHQPSSSSCASHRAAPRRAARMPRHASHHTRDHDARMMRENHVRVMIARVMRVTIGHPAPHVRATNHEPSTSRPSAIVVGAGTRPLMRPGRRAKRAAAALPPPAAALDTPPIGMLPSTSATRRATRRRCRTGSQCTAVTSTTRTRRAACSRGARAVLARCSRGARVVRARLPQIRCERAGRSFSLYSRPAASSRVFSLLACSPARRSVRRIATANARAARMPTRSGGSGRRRRAGPRMCVFCELFSSHRSSSFPSDVRIFGGVDRAVPRAAAPGQGGGGVACICARVLALLVGACFLVWSVVDHS
jgi:hypothetical protein